MFNKLSKKTVCEIENIVELKVAEIMQKTLIDFKFLESIQKLEVKDGDTLVFSHPERLSWEALTRLKVALEKAMLQFGYKIHLMVLDGGMTLEILTK